MEMVSVTTAHRLAARGRLDLIKRRLGQAAGRRSAARFILEAVVAQYSGDMERCVAIFGRAMRVATEAEKPYVVDLLGPVLVSQGQIDEAREAIGTIALIPEDLRCLFESLDCVIAAISGKNVASRLPMTLNTPDELHRARALQRTSLAAYHARLYECAVDSAKNSSRIFDRIGAYRSSAASLSVIYNVHHTSTGDIEEAYRTAKALAATALKARDNSFYMLGLVAQYEIAAEFGDAPEVERLKNSINRIAMPTQYRERFARGLADTLPFGWRGDFEALNANAIMLRQIPGIDRSALAFAAALRGVAEAALGDFAAARRTSRGAIGLAALTGASESALEVRYRRLARALSAATCILIGDSVRGRRAVSGKTLRRDDVFEIVAAADGSDWRTANRRVRGYARVVAAAHAKITATAALALTAAEFDVLRMLAEGKSAGQVAMELNRSVHTVRAHTRNIIGKFDVSGRVSAINHARRTGIIP